MKKGIEDRSDWEVMVGRFLKKIVVFSLPFFEGFSLATSFVLFVLF